MLHAIKLFFILLLVATIVAITVSTIVLTTNRNGRPRVPYTPPPTLPLIAEVLHGRNVDSYFGKKMSVSHDGIHLAVNEGDLECVRLFEADNLDAVEENVRWTLVKEYCDPGLDDYFGSDIVMCENGLTFVNAVFEREVQVYDRVSASHQWPSLPTHTIHTPGLGCGVALDMNTNCEVLAVGCSDLVAPGVGGILIFNRTDRETFEYTANLTVELVDASENGFGRSFELINDIYMNTGLVAGAPLNRGGNGTLHLFSYFPDSTTWLEESRGGEYEGLIAYDTLAGATSIGRSICAILSDHGLIIAISGTVDPDTNRGAVFIFGVIGNLRLLTDGPITLPDENDGAYRYFGTSLFCGFNGNTPYVAASSLVPNKTTPVMHICRAFRNFTSSIYVPNCTIVQQPTVDYPEHAGFNLTSVPDDGNFYGLLSPTGLYSMLSMTNSDGGRGRVYTKRLQYN